MARTTSLVKSVGFVEGMTERDPETLESLMDRYGSLVNHIVYRTIASRADAQDISQDVFLRVWRALPEFRFESKISTWIARIAYNTCINHLQKKREVLFDDMDGSEHDTEAFSGVRSGPDERTEQADLAERLEVEIRALPLRFRTILTLYHLEDMSYREIGQVMDVPEGTVKSYLFRARRMLRLRLMKKYDAEDLL